MKLEDVFTSTTKLSGVRYTDSRASTRPRTAGGGERAGRLGDPQGDNVKLGAGDTVGERGRSTSTASSGSPRCSSSSSSTLMEGSEHTVAGEKQRETFTVSFLLWGVPW